MHLFDELARAAAQGLTRRQALGRLGGLFGASVLGVLGLGTKARADSTASACAHFCNQLPTPRDGCENVCKACSDISKMCGTTGANQVCCNGTCCSGQCTDLNTDVLNCGACGSACAAGDSCCGGVCTNLQSDNANCGACGNVCAAGVTCTNGQCLCGSTVCAAGFTCCEGGHCYDLANDLNHCGQCDLTCQPFLTSCVGGICH
jgi:hypothetical protein